ALAIASIHQDGDASGGDIQARARPPRVFLADCDESGDLRRSVADVEVLGEQPPDFDDAAEEEDQKGDQEGEFDDARTAFPIRRHPPH
ncbi:MAG UNVERIFIED_CONTAM: hypothetical protein LOD86_12620, partial [Thermobifida fusca]